MVLNGYTNMTIEKGNILKSAKKKDKMDELLLKNPNLFKHDTSGGRNANTYDEDFNLSMEEHRREQAKQQQAMEKARAKK